MTRTNALQGKAAILYAVTFDEDKLGTTAGVDLEVSSWYRIHKKKVSDSALPLGEGYIFETPSTPAAKKINIKEGDVVQKMHFEHIARVDMDMTAAQGAIDVTDDSCHGYNESIPDGFSTVSGSFTTIIKTNDQGMKPIQKAFLNRFFSLVSDDGKGTYKYQDMSRQDFYIASLWNSGANTGEPQMWFFCPITLGDTNAAKPLKGAQLLTSSWTKGQGPAQLYVRSVSLTATAMPTLVSEGDFLRSLV